MNTADRNIVLRQLVVRCKKEDVKAQKALYEHTVNGLYNVIYRMTVDHGATQDLLQDSFVKIFQKINQFDESKGSVFNWMCRIAVNNAINYLNKRKLVFEDQEKFNLVPDLHFSKLEELEADYILKLIEQLPDAQRVIFNLHEIEGYKHSEIAEILKINTHTSRSYLSRAKAKLQKQIKSLQSNYNLKIAEGE